MTDIRFVPPSALNGRTVAFSVSDSADLTRLGLTPKHCELAIAELARAVLLAGGNLIYGGRLKPAGFTRILIDEVLRYGASRSALTLAVPATEHAHLDALELIDVVDQLGVAGQLVLLDVDGEVTEPSAERTAPVPEDTHAALTAMRRYVTQQSDARIVVGGKLTGYQGSMPGVIEEAILSLEALQPLFVAGGFGGAAAATASALGLDDQSWVPGEYPQGRDDPGTAAALGRVEQLQGSQVDRGLDEDQALALAATHRPGDIASLAVLGLARALNDTAAASGDEP